MNKYDFINNLSGILNDIRINKDEIIQKDETNAFFIKSKSKTKVFDSEFVIRKVELFAKLTDKAKSITEEENKLVITTANNSTIEFIKAQADIVEKPEAPQLDFSDAVKIILTDEVKAKINEAINTGFGGTLKFYTENKELKMSIGGKEGTHKYTTTITNMEKEISCFVPVESIKDTMTVLKGYSELYLKGTNFPLKFTDSTDNYETELLLAPKTEE